MKDIGKICENMLNNKYYSSKELIYSKSVGTFLSHFEYKKLLEYIFNDNAHKIELPLKTFNKSPLYFSRAFELESLVRDYSKVILDDECQKDSNLVNRNGNGIYRSRIYSEIEGTLNIESVPTTRKVVEQLVENKREPQSLNEQIIKNMSRGIEFVQKCPAFNEQNLFILYDILSNECLDEEDKLIKNNFYRHDSVEVGGYLGCPHQQIKECMDSLFKFVNENMNNPELVPYLPHIAHYYIAYVHPYFDYNGRTARMVSYWVSLLTNSTMFPPIVSEAINQTKSDYYIALSESRDSRNNITYFLIYLYKVSIKYFLTYKCIELISNSLKNNSIILTDLDKYYLKKIIISNKGKFSYKDFLRWINIDMSKQGALKILNAFEKQKILNAFETNSKIKLFEFNESLIGYKF